MIGPNGAGKTTLLRALAGLVPMTGEVRVGGRSWTDPPVLVRDRSIGYVFQDQSLFPHLSALDNVAFGRAPAASRAARRRRPPAAGWPGSASTTSPTAGPASCPAGRPSGSRSPGPWPPSPDLLLLDEPFAGLDVGVATALRIELARHLASYAGVALLVTHDALDALTLADRCWSSTRDGSPRPGTPHEVAARPGTDHVARLVGLNVHPRGRRCSARSAPARSRSRWPSPRAPRGTAGTGRCSARSPHGDAVRLLVGGDPELIADVTPAATAELGLAPGTRRVAVGEGDSRCRPGRGIPR